MKSKYLVAATGIIGLAAMPLSVGAYQNQNVGQRQGNRGGGYSAQTVTPTVQLTDSETALIKRMLEEEKLAGDLYTAFYAQWGNDVFSRVARSEARHESAVTKLATAYGVSGPRSSEVGVFTDQTLQALYTDLLAQGMKGEAAALEVARQFEIDDIAGLQAAQQQTEQVHLDRVFSNLERASKNHLREFTDAKNAL